jgi:hypothetical protein
MPAGCNGCGSSYSNHAGAWLWVHGRSSLVAKLRRQASTEALEADSPAEFRQPRPRVPPASARDRMGPSSKTLAETMVAAERNWALPPMSVIQAQVAHATFSLLLQWSRYSFSSLKHFSRKISLRLPGTKHSRVHRSAKSRNTLVMNTFESHFVRFKRAHFHGFFVFVFWSVKWWIQSMSPSIASLFKNWFETIQHLSLEICFNEIFTRTKGNL